VCVVRPRPSSHNSSCNFLDPWTDAPQRRGGYLSSDSTLASHKFSFGGPRVCPRVCQSFARALQATRCDAPRATLDASDRDAFAPLSRSLFILHAVQSTCVHSACIQSTCSIFFTSHTCWVIFSVATCCRLSNSFQVRELARAEEKAALGVGTRDVHASTSYTMQPRDTSTVKRNPHTAWLPLPFATRRHCRVRR
jgi:hypothetical protein